MDQANDSIFWSIGVKADSEFQEALLKSIKKINETYDAPFAMKENLMKTDIKIANNIVNTAARLLQAQSGYLQSMIVMADRQIKSPKFKKLLAKNLPAHMK